MPTTTSRHVSNIATLHLIGLQGSKHIRDVWSFSMDYLVGMRAGLLELQFHFIHQATRLEPANLMPQFHIIDIKAGCQLSLCSR